MHRIVLGLQVKIPTWPRGEEHTSPRKRVVQSLQRILLKREKDFHLRPFIQGFPPTGGTSRILTRVISLSLCATALNPDCGAQRVSYPARRSEATTADPAIPPTLLSTCCAMVLSTLLQHSSRQAQPRTSGTQPWECEHHPRSEETSTAL